MTRTDLLRALHDDMPHGAPRAKSQEPGRAPSRKQIKRTLQARLPSRIFGLLEQAGKLAERTGVTAYVVGGFVRDVLLEIRNFDVDVVIEGDGLAFAHALARESQAKVRTYERFGTATVVFPDGLKFDIATARTECYEFPAALPTVKRSSIKEDLYRRDFTINTLAIRLNTRRFGELIDCHGGRRDLRAKTIRVLHSRSFVDDPTRVFRAIRFEQRFGFQLGKETIILVQGAVKMDLFHRLSGHRLLAELKLLLSEQKPRRVIARMAHLQLLRFIHSQLAWSPRVDAVLKAADDTVDWYTSLYVDHEMETWLVYFMALLDVLPDKAVTETLKRLTMPARYAVKIRRSRSQVAGLLTRLTRRPPLRPSDVYHLLRRLTDEGLLLLLAKTGSEPIKRQISAYLTTYRHVRPALTGKDLKAMGLKPGPAFRKILEHLTDARLNGAVRSEAAERALVKQIVGL